MRARNITQMLVKYSEYTQSTSELLKAHTQYLVRVGIIDMGWYAHPAQGGSGHPEHPQPFADVVISRVI